MFTRTMSHDDLFHLMLHSDINTLTSICLSQHLEYCDSSMFWKLKFGHDELPILVNKLPTNFKDWRNEYIKVDTAANKAYELINHIKDNKTEALFNYNHDAFNFRNILSNTLKQALYQYTPNYKTFNHLSISFNHLADIYNITLFKNNNYVTINIELDDLYDVLIVIFYNYPDMVYQFTNL
jgi:hypothetical protein